MSSDRRQFVKGAASALLGGFALGEQDAVGATATDPAKPASPPGSLVGPAAVSSVAPEPTATTFAEAEKLVQFEMAGSERLQAAQTWRSNMGSLLERRTGPRKLALDAAAVPYSQSNPLLAGHAIPLRDEEFVLDRRDPGPLPKRDGDIAFAPVWKLARWVESRQLSSTRLTNIYIARIKKYDSQLRSVITLTEELALAQARQADVEIAAGHYRGPLHGIPWGAKDLLDTAGIPTTYGAEPFRDRVPSVDAAVVRRLHEAGAVLIAKLSLGALALNDVWFGGQTMNPWLLQEGAGGSSAGPGSATAAGLVGFSIGSETAGSIVDPSMRCGVCGLRPTFGKVPRTGAMTLCWSLDKLGPMTRSVEDTMLILRAVAGADVGDVASVPSHLRYNANADIKGLRIGFLPSWMTTAPATSVDRAVLQQVGKLGLHPIPVSLPDWPYATLNTILFAEAGAAFEEITLDRRLDTLRMQTADAWPNVFRQSRFVSAVDFVQADRFRRLVAQQMQSVMSDVDLLLVPSLRDEMLTISNFTGHPSLTLRAGFVEVSTLRNDWVPDPAHPLPSLDRPRRVPHGITLIGRHFEEGTIAQVGLALERAMGVADERPSGF